MRAFIQRHLDPATRVGEALFGLIMALGITGAVSIGTEQVTNRELLIAVLGCNVAWGIVDGVMFVMLSLFDRSRKARLVNHVQKLETDQAALEQIRNELSGQFELVTTSEQREQFFHWILAGARRVPPQSASIHRDDVLGGIAVGLLVLVTTLPILLPFAVLTNTYTAVRTSNCIALGLLFGLGWWWGREVETSPLRVSLSVTGVGLALVFLTIALGG